MRSLPQNLIFDPPWGGAEPMGYQKKVGKLYFMMGELRFWYILILLMIRMIYQNIFKEYLSVCLFIVILDLHYGQSSYIRQELARNILLVCLLFTRNHDMTALILDKSHIFIHSFSS